MDPHEVEKRGLLYEMEDELWKLLKRRAWIIGVIGLGGIWGLVHFTVSQVADRPLKELQKKLVEAEVQADRAKAAATAAGGAADQVTTQLGTLKDQAKSVEEQFRLVSERINAEAKNAALRSERDFNAALQRISALEALVKKIGEENETTRKATADYSKKIAILETQLKESRSSFSENSAYTVWIQFIPDKKALAQEVQSRLTIAGFKTPLNQIPITLFKSIPDAFKGTSLTYTPKSERKAQEVLALLRPILKDIQTRKLPERPEKLPDTPTKFPLLAEPSFLAGFEHYAEPTSIFLRLGT